MNIKRLVVEFGTVFAETLVTIAMVTFLWNIIGHGESTIDWKTSFSFAISFGIILTWLKSRDLKDLRQQNEAKVEILDPDTLFKGTNSLFCSSIELKMEDRTPGRTFPQLTNK